MDLHVPSIDYPTAFATRVNNYTWHTMSSSYSMVAALSTSVSSDTDQAQHVRDGSTSVNWKASCGICKFHSAVDMRTTMHIQEFASRPASQGTEQIGDYRTTSTLYLINLHHDEFMSKSAPLYSPIYTSQCPPQKLQAAKLSYRLYPCSRNSLQNVSKFDLRSRVTCHRPFLSQ